MNECILLVAELWLCVRFLFKMLPSLFTFFFVHSKHLVHHQLTKSFLDTLLQNEYCQYGNPTSL